MQFVNMTDLHFFMRQSCPSREAVNIFARKELWFSINKYCISIGYFTVGELVRFLFTSCVKQTNERSE